MKIYIQPPLKMFVLYIALIPQFSCSKDYDLFTDYVIADIMDSKDVESVVVDDTYQVTSSGCMVLDVLSNDTFKNEAEAIITETSAPTNGIVTINNAITLTYTPNAQILEKVLDTAKATTVEIVDMFTYTTETKDDNGTLISDKGNVTIVVHDDTKSKVVYTATTYYVSSTGNDKNSGTSENSAWQSLTKINSFKPIPGDKILFKRGDRWTGTITVDTCGTASSPITLGAYGIGAKPILSAVDNNPAITATAANRGYWTIDGLDIRSTGHPSGLNQTLGIYFNYWPNEMGAVPGWVIKNCTFNSCILVSGPNTIIKDNVFNGAGNSNNKYGAIQIRGNEGADVIIEGNTISNYIDRGIWIYNGVNRAIIRNNTIHDIEIGDDQNGAGINIDGYTVTNFDSRVYGNTIYNCGYAISHENAFGGITYNNLIYDSETGMTVGIYSDDFGSPLNLSIHHNIIYNTDRGFMLLHCNNVTFANNVLFKDDGLGSFKVAFVIYETNKNVSNLTFVNNIIAGVWDSAPIATYFADLTIWKQFDYNIIIPTGTTIYSQNSNNRTLAYIQGEGLMTHGLISDPLFISEGRDFKLQSGSPAINAGVDIGLKSDYRGYPLVGVPDIGAYAY